MNTDQPEVQINACNQTDGASTVESLGGIEVNIAIEADSAVSYINEAFPRFNHGLPHPLLLEEREPQQFKLRRV